MFEDLTDPALELMQRNARVTKTKAIDLESKTALQAKEIPKTQSAGAAAGVKGNAKGNFKIFITGLVVDAVITGLCLVLFSLWRKWYPIMFKDNVLKGHTNMNRQHTDVPDGFFGWARASWSVSIDDTWNTAGLDHAMMLEYLNLALKTFTWIAFPMFFIMGPLNFAFGGNADGQDRESDFSMGNVEFYCWLYWPISFMICYVCWCVTWMCHKGMKEFMPRRFEWLQAVKPIRAQTIMMLGIPGEYQSDEACKKFFNTLLPGSVEKVSLTKDTSLEGNLKGLVVSRDQSKYQLKLAEAAWAKDANDPDKRPTIKTSYFGSREDAIETYTKKIQDLEPAIKQERDNVYKKAKDLGPGSGNLSNGFITFKDRKSAEIALSLDLSDDVNDWVLGYPPTPADVIWEDFTQDPRAEGGRALIGWSLVGLLVLMYMPIVVFVCNVAEMINMGPLQSIWASEAPSLGLTLMVDFLPTILMIIFKSCMSMYDESVVQSRIAVWYWWMNVLYVVMITALGTNFMSFVETLAKDPLSIFSLLADTMPSCTHYYMNYVAMQSYVHAMVLIRYSPLAKFRMQQARGYDEQEAKDLVEPEAQDYYGIGSRCARWSTLVCIGVVYGTLSPPVSLLSFLLFAWLRLVYGYLMVFAESKKEDLGGIFFCQALNNTWTTLHIYLILMLGVFIQRASSWGPVLIVAIAWGFVTHSQKKFYEYKWEKIPYPDISASEKKITHRIPELTGSYVQPELCL